MLLPSGKLDSCLRKTKSLYCFNISLTLFSIGQKRNGVIFVFFLINVKCTAACVITPCVLQLKGNYIDVKIACGFQIIQPGKLCFSGNGVFSFQMYIVIEKLTLNKIFTHFLASPVSPKNLEIAQFKQNKYPYNSLYIKCKNIQLPYGIYSLNIIFSKS